jgi:hypothetical protein
MAYLAHRISAYRSVHRSQRYRHDLHSEVAEEREALRSTVQGLPELLEAAKRSRPAAEEDLAEAKLLGSQLAAADTEDMGDSGMELDIQLAEILALSIRANRLADKYRRVVSEELDAESLFEQAAAIPAQARAQHAAFIAPS